MILRPWQGQDDRHSPKKVGDMLSIDTGDFMFGFTQRATGERYRAQQIKLQNNWDNTGNERP